MVIGIDASRYGHSSATGVERYSYEIISRVYKMAVEKGHEVRLYTPELIGDFPEEHQVVIKRKKFWTLVGLSKEMRKNKPDVLFVPSHVLPRNCPKNSLIMIHDIAFMRYPKVYGLMQRLYLKHSTGRAVKFASKILVPTAFTGKELEEVYKCPAEKIEVVHHGANDLPEFSDFEKNNVFTRVGLNPHDKYIFFVGRLELKKNLARLVRAFIMLRHGDWKLVLGGKAGYGSHEIVDIAMKSDARDRILFPHYLTEVEKAALLENASIAALPSLYEGFGMPVLEAFKTKTPVLASDIPALREVAGNAAYLVNPLDEKNIAQGLDEMIRDEGMRDRMVKMGLERLSEFSWNTATEKTWRAIEGAVK